MEASVGRARRLLRRARTPHLLDRDPVALRLCAALRTPTTFEAIHVLLERALRDCDPRLRLTIDLVDRRRGLGKVASAEMHLSQRHFYRLRAVALDAVAHELDALLDGASSPAVVDDDTLAWYARGRYLVSRRTGPAFDGAQRCFEMALRCDPNFARAHAALAEVHLLTAEYELRDPRRAFADARRALTRAFELGAHLPESLAAAGDLALFADGNPDRARTLFEAAIAADPSYSGAYNNAAWLELMQRNHAAAADLVKQGLLREPSSLVLQTTLGLVYRESGRTRSGIDQLRSVVDADGRLDIARFHLAAALVDAGDFDAALAELELLLTDRVQISHLAARGHVRGRLGDRLGALRDLRALDAMAPGGEPQHEFRAVVLAGLGQSDASLAELESVVRDRRPLTCRICLAPFFRVLAAARVDDLFEASQKISVA
jgi:tetratricopeptide (TPR) repeat protein